MTFEPLTADRRRQQTRDYLLQAAAQVFAERGYYAASLDEVAAAAGYTKGAVYSNFKNKEDLFLALIESMYAREVAALKETLEDSDIPPERRLGDFVGLIRRELDQVPDNWGALYLEFSLYAMRNPEVRDRLNQLENMDIEVITGLIEEGSQRLGVDPSRDSANAARIVVALFRGLGLMRELAPDAVSPELLEAAMDFVARGLGAGD
ncbi:MAG TPA: TetR/AcrR family transcriptional regulator [Acidimicrobiales bacterium]|jgi:AcrR family transcriptional regulator|nr:TetR/AcrR family transcriptional regulator [Acidimicrobiales bacterium]